jgi:hypothetical protein
MATPFHTTVDLRGIHFEDRKITMVLNSAIVKADEGKPVTIDSANNRVKIAGDGDNILGVLEVVEDRTIEGIKVGTIAFNYVAEWPIKAADTLAVGDVAVGSTVSGEVKKATLVVTTAQEPAVKPWGKNIVVAVSNGKAVVAKI